MAYRDAVKYIEDMKPNYVNAVGDECLRTKAIIQTALPTLSGLPGNVDWRSDAAALYEQRLKETIELVEGLHDGFDKAGKAVADYVQAQRQAQARVADGVNAESQLHALIAPIVATQSFQVRFSDALRQWNDLRSTTGVTDWVIELPEHDEINKVRAEADELWYRATDAYDDYTDGTGTDMQVDYEEAYREDPAIGWAVDNEIAYAQQEAERIYRETGQTGFQMTGNPSLATERGGYPSTENWQKTLGDHTIYGTSQVVVNGDQITMKIKVHAEDMYNFDLDASDIATEAPDEENGRFSTLGWAKGFRTHGELERTVTWTIGESPDISDGTGPERHVFGEDRPDGREDG